MRNHYAQIIMVGSIAAMTSAVCARGISFLGALCTVRVHGEYNYRDKITRRPVGKMRTCGYLDWQNADNDAGKNSEL